MAWSTRSLPVWRLPPIKCGIFGGKHRDRSSLYVGAPSPWQGSPDDLAIHVDPAVVGDLFAVGTFGLRPFNMHPC